MKVVCINNVELGKDSYGKPRHKILPVTIGQTYEVEICYDIPGKGNFYMLEKDNNEVEGMIYSTHYFVTIDVWREMQLNKII
jgi:hypothetical protein